MDHKAKLERLKELTPESEFRLFLIDLLKRAGFKNVQHSHKYGAPEFGKDIIASHIHLIDEAEWYAFVVKIGRISGNTTEIETIKNQISQCFEYPFEALDGSAIRVNKVKVASNENISNGAQQAIRQSKLMSRDANIDFWYNEKIIDLVDKFYPEFWAPYSPAIAEYCAHTEASVIREFELKGLSGLTFDDAKARKLIDLFIEPSLIENRMVEESGKERYFGLQGLRYLN